MLVPTWTLIVAAIVWLAPIYPCYKLYFSKEYSDNSKYEQIAFSFLWPVYGIHAIMCIISKKL